MFILPAVAALGLTTASLAEEINYVPVTSLPACSIVGSVVARYVLTFATFATRHERNVSILSFIQSGALSRDLLY